MVIRFDDTHVDETKQVVVQVLLFLLKIYICQFIFWFNVLLTRDTNTICLEQKLMMMIIPQLMTKRRQDLKNVPLMINMVNRLSSTLTD